MRVVRVVRVVVAALALLLVAVPTAVAGGRGGGEGRGGHPAVVPVRTVAGSTGGRVLGDWFVENLRLPASSSPAAGTANLCLHVGRGDRVLAPAVGLANGDGVYEIGCRLRAGQALVVLAPSAECSSVEQPPFFGADAREQRRCAVAQAMATLVSATVSVDGRRPVDVRRHAFFAVSSQRRVVLPADPVIGSEAGPATFVAAGWLARIRGLTPGRHTVSGVFIVAGEDGSTATATFVLHVQVVPGRGSPVGRTALDAPRAQRTGT